MPVLPVTNSSPLRGRILRAAFGIADNAVCFSQRGFHQGDLAAVQQLEEVGRAFVGGYHAALLHGHSPRLVDELNAVEALLSGFAFEGAAMGLQLLDLLDPRTTQRLQDFAAGPADPHIYMAHVGAGWAIARIPWARRQVSARLQTFDPLLAWLVVDGYGFHEGYFHWKYSVHKQRQPRHLSGYACRAFDQGLGRSLWFLHCANVERLAHTVSTFPETRQGDLWSGIGLASTYAGGCLQGTLERLRCAAHVYRSHLAQGAAFAAQARLRAGNLVEHTEQTCQVLMGIDAKAAACMTQAALNNLPSGGTEPAYETWRTRIRERCTDLVVDMEDDA